MNTPKIVRNEGVFDFTTALGKAKKHPAYWQEDILLDVANRLAAELSARNMTQAELAKKLAVKPAYVSRVLRGHENLTIQTLAKIAFAFDKRWECILVDQDAHILYSDCKTKRHTETAVIPAITSLDNNYDDEVKYA